MANRDFQVRVKNGRELRSRLRGAENKELRKANRDSYQKASEVIAEQARLNAPEGATGKLRKSIKGRGTQRAGTVKVGTAKSVPYAGAIHWGWKKRNIQPNPFVTRAIQTHLGKARKVFEREISKVAKQLSS